MCRAASGTLSFDVRPGAGGTRLSDRELYVLAAAVPPLVVSRTELAARALRDGWLDAPPNP